MTFKNNVIEDKKVKVDFSTSYYNMINEWSGTSGSYFLVDLYEFVGSSGTNQGLGGLISSDDSQKVFCRCEYCGAKNYSNDLECHKCGAPL